MNMTSLYPIITKSFRYLLSQRLRAISSLLGVLLGVMAVVTMLSIGEGAKREATEQIRQLGLNNIIVKQLPGSEKPLLLEEFYKLKNSLTHLQSIAPLAIVEANLHAKRKELMPEILATDATFSTIYQLEMDEGRYLTHYDTQHRQLHCVLGSEIARALGNEGRLGKTLRIENQMFKIIGILKPRHWASGKAIPINAHNINQNIFIPISTKQAISLKDNSESLTEIIIQLDKEKDVATAAQIINRSLQLVHRNKTDYQVIIPQELIRQANATQRTFNFILGSIACISLLIGGIGIMNIMLATITERTREIGIRRAVGANKTHILFQFLFETLILTLSGAALGVIFGIFLSTTISFVAGWKTIITVWSIIISFILAAGVGVFAGFYPALKASRIHPIEAIRNL